MIKKDRCDCGKRYCAIHSKVSMKVMVKDEYKNSYSNTVFHCFIKQNKKPDTTIVLDMLKRLEGKFRNAYNCILFYNNTTNTEIHRHPC